MQDVEQLIITFIISIKFNHPLIEKFQEEVVRGGSFDSSAGALRITNRVWLHPKNKVFPKVTTYGQVMNEIFNYIGFRCAHSTGRTPSGHED